MCTAATYKTKDFILEELLITNFLTVMKLQLHRETMPLIFVIQALAAPLCNNRNGSYCR